MGLILYMNLHYIIDLLVIPVRITFSVLLEGFSTINDLLLRIIYKKSESVAGPKLGY